MEAPSTPEQGLRRCNTNTSLRSSRRAVDSPHEHITAISPSAYHRVNSLPPSSFDASSVSSSSSSSSTLSLGHALSQSFRLPSSASTASLTSGTHRRTRSPHGSTARIASLSGSLHSLRQLGVEHQRQIEDLEDAQCHTVESLEELNAHFPEDSTNNAANANITPQHATLRVLIEEVSSLTKELHNCKAEEFKSSRIIGEMQSKLQGEKERHQRSTECAQCEMFAQQEREAEGEQLVGTRDGLRGETEALRTQNAAEVAQLQERLHRLVQRIEELKATLPSPQTQQAQQATDLNRSSTTAAAVAEELRVTQLQLEQEMQLHAATEEGLRSLQLENQRLQERIHDLQNQLDSSAAAREIANSEPLNEFENDLHIQIRPDLHVDQQHETATTEDRRDMKHFVQGLSYTLTAGVIVAAGVRVGIDLFGKYLRNS